MARWTDLAEWRGPTTNQGPGMAEQRGLVIHIAEGYYEGTIAWQRNPDSNVSSTFVVAGPLDQAKSGDHDGKIAQMVETQIAAWTQRAGNGHWLSSENSGFTPTGLSAAQIEANAQLFARGVRELGWPLQLAGNPNGRGLGFHSMGTPSNGWTGPTWGHEDCPGPNIIAQLPAILARAQQIVTGVSPNRKDDLMFAVKEATDNAVWLTSGLRRRTGATWDQIMNLAAAGLLTKPAVGADSSGWVLVVPDGQLEAYAGPLDVIDGGGNGGGGTPAGPVDVSTFSVNQIADASAQSTADLLSTRLAE